MLETEPNLLVKSSIFKNISMRRSWSVNNVLKLKQNRLITDIVSE